jgi:hypothetical protein
MITTVAGGVQDSAALGWDLAVRTPVPRLADAHPVLADALPNANTKWVCTDARDICVVSCVRAQLCLATRLRTITS